MKVRHFRLVGIRCFEDTGAIKLGDGCNIFIGSNNSGKSTLLKAVLQLQGFPFSSDDVRFGAANSSIEVLLHDLKGAKNFRNINPPKGADAVHVAKVLAGPLPHAPDSVTSLKISDDHGIFQANRPHHHVVPLLARRKAPEFSHGVTTAQQAAVTGTFVNLYSRVDQLATAGHPRHRAFLDARDSIIGVPIATRASSAGKQAGFYLDDNAFVTLERMGDGVTEMVALIVELCLEKDKIFILEEPETNLHPRALKALLSLVRDASKFNQFLIATHSNIVVRELAFDPSCRVFRVSRDTADHASPSIVEEVEHSSAAHLEVLRDLGYEFTDIGIHDAWLFLEEASAETVIRDVLIPMFAPALAQRLRTYSAAGVGNIEPSVAEFQRLVTFIHLEPVYRQRLWIRADGDPPGRAAVEALRAKFDHLDANACAAFSRPAFEHYYPTQFTQEVEQTLALPDRRTRRASKARLLNQVLDWSAKEADLAREAWATSASEVIAMLQDIETSITGRGAV